MPEYEHLLLPSRKVDIPRRGKTPGRTPSRGENRQHHAETLVQQADNLSESLRMRVANSPTEIDPKLIFKLNLHSSGSLDEKRLASIGLKMLARTPERAIVVFPDEPTLSGMRDHLRQHAGQVPNGNRYDYLTSIEAITELTAEDRTGNRLRNSPLGEEETASLDIELWHAGTHARCMNWINEIRALLAARALTVTDQYIGDNLCLLRAKVNSESLDTLINVDFIKEVDRRPSPSFDMRDIVQLGLEQLDQINPPSHDAVGVVVVDSGVMSQHPLIAQALGEAEVFPDRLRERLQGGPQDGDERTGGHGTAVAGVAIYDSVSQSIDERTFTPLAKLFSARVTDENNEYDEDSLLESQLDNAVTYFVDHYPQVKVINISLGNAESILTDSQYQFRFAAAIDGLAYRYRDRQLVFVVSAGNYWPDVNRTAEEAVANYPSFLIDDPDARIIDPATAALAITVGGLSNGFARHLNRRHDDDLDGPVAKEKGWPASLTRVGWGLSGSIKPEVVEISGDLAHLRGRLVGNHRESGVPTLNKEFANGRMFRTAVGTSYAAPRVANLAARLFQVYPEASSNLIRALIADSALIPNSKPPILNEKPWTDTDLLRIYGYGQPNFERARYSEDNRALLLHDGKLEINRFHIFELPLLPPQFFTARGAGFISVTLAYDPPTRATRFNEYLGITMSFEMFRNTSAEDVESRFKLYTAEEKNQFPGNNVPKLGEVPSRQRVTFSPKSTLRSKGTLQKGVCRIPTKAWHYEAETPLYLGVMCRPASWLPASITEQSFSIVASVSHESDDVPIHETLRLRARQYQRIRQRLRG